MPVKEALRGALSLLRDIGSRAPEARAPLLPTREIPARAEATFAKRYGMNLDRPIDPDRARELLYTTGPRDVIDMLYGDALGRGRFARSDTPLSFRQLSQGLQAPNFKLVTPRLNVGPDSELVGNLRTFRGTQRANEFYEPPYMFQGKMRYPSPQYFEKALIAPDDLTMMSLPEEFLGSHFLPQAGRHPVLGSIRGSYDIPYGNSGLGPRVYVEELQSDPYQLLRKAHGEGRYTGIKLPAILENIYGNLAKAGLQRAAKLGASEYNIITPEVAAMARGESLTNPFLQRIYGSTLEKQFYGPVGRELGAKFTTKPLELDTELELSKSLSEVNLPYRSLSLTPEMRKYIVEKGLSGFRSGGLYSCPM